MILQGERQLLIPRCSSRFDCQSGLLLFIGIKNGSIPILNPQWDNRLRPITGIKALSFWVSFNLAMSFIRAIVRLRVWIRLLTRDRLIMFHAGQIPKHPTDLASQRFWPASHSHESPSIGKARRVKKTVNNVHGSLFNIVSLDWRSRN